MTETTLEEARRCPRCEQPGKLVRKEQARGATPGSEQHIYECDNSRCKWHKQVCRVVTVRADGSIPQAEQRNKNYPSVPDMTDRVNQQIAAQLELEQSGGGEIRNPYAR